MCGVSCFRGIDLQGGGREGPQGPECPSRGVWPGSLDLGPQVPGGPIFKTGEHNLQP